MPEPVPPALGALSVFTSTVMVVCAYPEFHMSVENMAKVVRIFRFIVVMGIGGFWNS